MLSEKIYRFRRSSGLSQEQLAEKLGVSRQAISKWESGTSTHELDKLRALSECFHITLDELVSEEPPAQRTARPPQEAEESAKRERREQKVGVGLCLLGAVCLCLFGVLLLLRPDAAGQLNAASTVTVSGSGILLGLCVLSMLAGLVLLLRKK